MYYLQDMSQILSSGSLTIMFATVTQFFNLSLITTGDGSDLCFVEGMTAKHKIISNLLIPSLAAIFIALVHAIVRYGCNGSGVIN